MLSIECLYKRNLDNAYRRGIIDSSCVQKFVYVYPKTESYTNKWITSATLARDL
jgi:hypothetical protein